MPKFMPMSPDSKAKWLEEREKKRLSLRPTVLRARQLTREWVRLYIQIGKAALGGRCVGCGESDERLLQFDHRKPHRKLYHVSNMKGMRIELIAEEIMKCRLLCCNCHHLHTHYDEVPDNGEDYFDFEGLANFKRRRTEE